MLRAAWERHGHSRAGREERKRLNPPRYPEDAEVSVSDKDLSELNEQRNETETGGIA